MAEINPFEPVVPDSIRATNPELHEFLRSMVENLRQQHNASQVGDTTYTTELLSGYDLTPQHTLGIEGRFSHPDYGLVRAKYVRFNGMNPEAKISCPVGLLSTSTAFSWTMTNQSSRTTDGIPRGLLCGARNPIDGEYGWILTQGINLLPLEVIGKPQVNSYLVWNADSTIELLGTEKRVVGQVLALSQVTAGGGIWTLPAGLILLDLGTGIKTGVTDSVESNDKSEPAPPAGLTVFELERKFELFDRLNKLTVSSLQRQVFNLTQNEASVESVDRLQAMANFASLAGTAESNASRAAGLTHVNLEATNTLTRIAKVYRDEAGFYSQSTTIFANEAALSANEGAISASASAVSVQEAKTQADAAGVSAEASRMYSLNAEVSNQGAVSAAQSSEQFAVQANQFQASASQASTLAAQYRDESKQDYTSAHAELTQFGQVLASYDGRSEVYWGVVGVAGDNRASIELRVNSDPNKYTGFDITGNVRINGNLLVTGTVSTPQLAPQAVTQFVNVIDAGGDLSGSLITPAANLTSQGGLILILVSFDYIAANGTNARYYVVLRRNGIEISRYISLNQINNTTNKAPVSFFYTESPGAGTVSYDLRFAQSSGSNGALAWSNVNIFVQEFKR